MYLKPALWCAALAVALGVAFASAQVFPPLLVYGSITDEDGPVGAGVAVEAYIGDVLCGASETELEDEGQITIYYIRVLSHEDRPGCGTPDAEVQIWVGEKPAPETVRWQAGPHEYLITFGDVAPAPIPTFTSTPEATSTPTLAATEQPTPAATDQPTRPVATSTRPPQSPEPTIRGGVTSATPEPGDVVMRDSGSGEFPLWIAVVLVLGGIGMIGGGLGYAMSRSHDDDADDMSD